MLEEARRLQGNAVDKLCKVVEEKDEVFFKAPTGSGKTYMMSDFMDKVLEKRDDVIFIVSSLSKGDLAEQNHESFLKFSRRRFTSLKPYLINSEISGEGRLFIPQTYNVYSLPRDLYKEKSRLKKGGLESFLWEIKFGLGKEIYVIKDECHIKTNNLDSLKERYFSKIINFSATPKISKGRKADVEISEKDAVKVHLIKRKEINPLSELKDDDGKELDNALGKFIEIRKDYEKYVPNINPCMIIQISNKDKADDEVTVIKDLLDNKYPQLRWMLIVENEKKCETTCFPEDKIPPVREWKKLAKENSAQVDVIIFKMVISEGWDIPRACMLFQMRDSKSRQLDKQVMGRVRRNPCLLDYEKLSSEARRVIDTAYIYGIKDEKEREFVEIKASPETNFSVKTTVLKRVPSKEEFDYSFLDTAKEKLTFSSIFDLYKKYKKSSENTKEVFREYSKGKNVYQTWLKVAENIEELQKRLDTYEADYSSSMVLASNDDGSIKETQFPVVSYMESGENYTKIEDWLWIRPASEDFYFDSEAEKKWAKLLHKLSSNIKKTDGSRYMYGKNYFPNTEIRYEYFSEGKIHSSYPDFILKDKEGDIHIFESKSLNKKIGSAIDNLEYENKIRDLKECYVYASKITGYNFYIPILKNEKWYIWKMSKGKAETITPETLFSDLR